MAIIVLHGNGLQGIRNTLLQFKKNYDKSAIQEFSKSTDWSEVLTALKTPNLFADNQLIVVESPDEKQDLTDLLEDTATTVIFVFPKELLKTSPFLKQAIAKKADIRVFSEKEEQLIFPFLDLIAEKKNQALGRLDPLLDQYGSQYLITMFVFSLRRFVLPPKNIPPFVVKKIEQQKRNFPQSKITQLYKKILETDFKLKRGLIEERTGMTLLVKSFLAD